MDTIDLRVVNLGGINNKISPFNRADGELTRCVNMYTDQVGAKRKRVGYGTLAGTADGSAPQSLFQWISGDNSKNYLYRASGTKLYYYDVNSGAGDWTVCGNGTITANAHVGHAVLDDTLIIGEAAGSTRHTTDGTSFTNTTLAPVGEYLEEKYNRIFIGGTASDLFYSTTNDATNWSLSGTADSSSIKITGAGRINSTYSAMDRLMIGKNSGVTKRWDDYSLVTIPTSKGYSSPYSRAEVEGYHIGLNRLGYYGYGGNAFELLSNPIQSQIYNDDGTGISGPVFSTAPAVSHKYMYYCSVGNLTDFYTKEPIANCIHVYNYQLNEWYDYKFNNLPTAWCSYIDKNNNEQLMFGASGGQCYQMSGTATTDSGQAIESVLEGFIHTEAPENVKLWNHVHAFANPGCQAHLQLAASSTFTRDDLDWFDCGDLRNGVLDVHRKSLRGRFLYYKITENSKDTPFVFYGFTTEYDVIGDI
jgi:hypothetical protein